MYFVLKSIKRIERWAKKSNQPTDTFLKVIQTADVFVDSEKLILTESSLCLQSGLWGSKLSARSCWEDGEVCGTKYPNAVFTGSSGRFKTCLMWNEVCRQSHKTAVWSFTAWKDYKHESVTSDLRIISFPIKDMKTEHPTGMIERKPSLKNFYIRCRDGLDERLFKVAALCLAHVAK